MSLDEVKIKIDQGTFTQSANGRLTISRKAGCVSWGLLLTAGPLTLGAVATTIYFITKLPEPNIELSHVFQGLGLVIFLGYATFYLFKKVRFEEITIDPVTRLIKIGNRVIPFLDVDEVMFEGKTVPLMDGVVADNFVVMLNSGEKVSLGSISGDARKIDQPAKQILSILGTAIKGKG